MLYALAAYGGGKRIWNNRNDFFKICFENFKEIIPIFLFSAAKLPFMNLAIKN
jgi:hypothetical protein